MEVQTLLLSIIFVHTWDGSERNFAVKTQIYEARENDSIYSDDIQPLLDYIRGQQIPHFKTIFEVPEAISPFDRPNLDRVKCNGTIEDIYNITEEIMPHDSTNLDRVKYNETTEDRYNITEEIMPCDSTNLEKVKCNETTEDIYHITDDAVLFLKGPMVTRLMPSFYIIIILISLPLNAVALVTFTCGVQEKHPTVIYMSHLACVDLLFTLLLPLKIHYQMNSSVWVFGEAACRVLSAAYYCYMYCSILLMMSMSVDRLLAVVFPIASLNWRSAKKATCICVLVWLLAFAGTVPLLSITQTFKIKDVGVTCHDILHHKHLYAYMFSILSCLYFFLPLVVTLVSYSTIIYVLNTKNDNLETTYSDKRRRAVIMAIAVLMAFVVCFAPTNGILLYHCVRLATGGSSEEGKYYLIAVCLGSTSVFLDPLLYYYGSSQCRKQIHSLIWCMKTKKHNHAI